MKPILIKLLNGASVKTFHSGIIHFNKYFYLDNVLYPPEFHTNLIYIPRIATALNCTIYFDSFKCLIHGNLTLRMIGTTKLTNGLYMLAFPFIFFHISTKSIIPNNSIYFKSCNNIFNRCDIWHNRVSHLLMTWSFISIKYFLWILLINLPPFVILVLWLNKNVSPL